MGFYYKEILKHFKISFHYDFFFYKEKKECKGKNPRFKKKKKPTHPSGPFPFCGHKVKTNFEFDKSLSIVTPRILALRRLSQKGQEFKVSLGYIVSSGLAWAHETQSQKILTKDCYDNTL